MRYLPLLLAALLPLPALADDAPPGTPGEAAAPTGSEVFPAAGAPAAGVPAADDAGPAAVALPAEAEAGAVAPVAPPPSWIYLVARVKLKDTDLTQVAFLRHPQVTTLEACEAERSAGLTTGWRYFNRYYFRTLKGISYQIDFRCVEGTQYLAPWRKGELLNRHYLVKTADATLRVEEQETFFACRRALRQSVREEGIDAFCATASQAVLPPPTPEVEDTDAATPAADAPVPIPASPAPAATRPPAPVR